MTNLIDVHLERAPDGWRIDAFVHGTTDTIGHPERFTGERFATLDDAYRHAVKTFSYRLASLAVRVPT